MTAVLPNDADRTDGMAAGAFLSTSVTDTTPVDSAREAASPTQSDESLAADAARDVIGAFDALARRYQVPLLRFLLRSTRHAHDAEDALQETFRRLFAARRRFDATQRFRPWAFAVARHVAIDAANDRRTRHLRLRPLDADAAVVVSPMAPGETSADADERLLLWDLARDALPPEQVQALWLFHVERMPAGEIAVVLGKSWVGVKTMLVRARRTLRGAALAHQRRRAVERTQP